MKYTAEQIQERFESLPENVKAALTSEDVDLKIQEIARKHNLHIDQAGDLADETGLVMLGLTQTGEYIENLRERLGIPRQEATEIAKDMDEMVFKPVKTSLVGMSEPAGETEENLDREELLKELHEHLGADESNKKPLTIDQKQSVEPDRQGAGEPAVPAIATGAVAGPAPAVIAGIVEKKLTETVKIPAQETVIDRTKNRYGGQQDPYREPIE